MLGASFHAGSPVFWRPFEDATAAWTKLVIEGDSITFAGGGGGFAHQYAAAPPAGRTVSVNAENSRTVGGSPYALEGDDTGTPAGNTLAAHAAEDIASGARLVAAMIGANDLSTKSVGHYRADLIAYHATLAAAGVKFAWSPPVPLRSDKAVAGGAAYYDAWMSKRAVLVNRDPAVWGQWADYYIPLGEQPEMNAADNVGLYSGDGVHPNQAGQDALFPVEKASLDTLLDASRAASTSMYPGAWPSSEDNLPTSTQLVRRFVIKGLAHGGIALTGANALSVSGGGAQLRRGGDGGPGWSASYTGWLYNGDTVDVRLTTDAANSADTTVMLQVGSETRTLTYRTGAAVTPASVVTGGIVNIEAAGQATHSTIIAFPDVGVGVVAVSCYHPTGPSVTFKGAACAKLAGQNPDQGVWLYALPVASTAAGQLSITFPFAPQHTVIWYGIVKDADATPVSTGAPPNPNTRNPNWSTGAITVPAGGLMLAFLGMYDDNTTDPATVTGGTLLSSGFGAVLNGDRYGIAAAARAASGAVGFSWSKYADQPVAYAVFKAAGT